MHLLIKNAKVIDSRSDFHLGQVDLLIRDGLIAQVGTGLQSERAMVIEREGLHVSPGWLDLGVTVGDPGHEQREDLESAAAAAAAGGFTAIAVQPNTDPAIDTKGGARYVRQQSMGQLVDCYPLGAVSHGCAGKELTEMIDMQRAGAIAFTDGHHPIQHSGLMMRGLQYVKAFGGVLINRPQDKHLSVEGQMHEGAVSTALGMKGIPSLSEELMVQRDLYLAEYTGSRLHLAFLSTAGAVERVREAKLRGLQVTCSVAPLNLAFGEEALQTFDTYFKVMPPLRSREDVRALQEGVADGAIDLITSNHVPLEEELKKLEFPFAGFGAAGLETVFPLTWKALQPRVSLEDLVERLAIRSRELVGLETPVIGEGVAANLTLFEPESRWTVQPEDLRGKSHNNPLIGQQLQGRVVGLINNNQSTFSPL